MERKIGVIDSGVGGLTVAKEIAKEMPQESFIYFGDTARCPYGNKTIEEIKHFVYDMTDFLMKKEMKALVVACNTATAIMIDELKANLPIPVIGVIEPGAYMANQQTKTGSIGVIATTRTIESGIYENEIRKLNPGATVVSKACPMLVPLIEKGEIWRPESIEKIEASLFPLRKESIDTLILGCTHYPIIAQQIHEYFEGKVNLIDPAKQTVAQLKRILKENGMESTYGNVQHEYYVSGDVDAFNQTATQWCKRNIQAELHSFSPVIQ